MNWLFGSFRIFFLLTVLVWAATQSRRWGLIWLDEEHARTAFWAVFAGVPVLIGALDAFWGKRLRGMRANGLCALAGGVLVLASRPEVSFGMAIGMIVASAIVSFLARIPDWLRGSPEPFQARDAEKPRR